MAGHAARNCSTTKADTALTTLSATFGATNTSQTRWGTWVSDTLDTGQTISGTVSLVVGKCAETSNSGDAHLAFVLRVVTGSGTHRATLASHMATSSEFPLMANAATRIHSALSITSFAAAAGDRLVLEIGIHGVTPANETMQMRWGDPTATSDFALTAGLTTDLVPWVELSQTVTFGAESHTGTAVVTGNGTTASAVTTARSVAPVASGSGAATVVAGKGAFASPTVTGNGTTAAVTAKNAASAPVILSGVANTVTASVLKNALAAPLISGNGTVAATGVKDEGFVFGVAVVSGTGAATVTAAKNAFVSLAPISAGGDLALMVSALSGERLRIFFDGALADLVLPAEARFLVQSTSRPAAAARMVYAGDPDALSFTPDLDLWGLEYEFILEHLLRGGAPARGNLRANLVLQLHEQQSRSARAANEASKADTSGRALSYFRNLRSPAPPAFLRRAES